MRVDLEITVEHGAHGAAAAANGVVDAQDGFIPSRLDREGAGVFAVAAADHREAGVNERVERQRREDRGPTGRFCGMLKMSSRKLRSKGVTGSLTTFSMVVPCEAHSLSKMLSGMSAGRVKGL